MSEVVESMSAVEEAVEKLKAGIRTGKYVPGQRFVSSDLERDLGVGRSTVREALRELAGDGYVVQEANRGTFVRRLEKADVLNMNRVREVIEGLAAGLAAERIKQGASATKLKALYREITDVGKSDDVPGYMALNEQLHTLIIEMSENPWLQSAVERLRLPLLRIQYDRFVNQEGKEDSMEGHDKVVSAILAGDGPKAERAMRAHIRGSRRLIERLTNEDLGL